MLGDRLKGARKAARLTQDYVAAELKCTRQALSSWERNKSVPSAPQLGQLAILYGVWADTLLFGIEKPRPGGIDWADVPPDVRQRLDLLWQVFGRQVDGAADVVRIVEDDAAGD